MDDGEGMEPFADDQLGLIDVIRGLVGEGVLEVRTIHEVPDSADPLYPWEPPPAGTPVLALTDLGLSGRTEVGIRKLIAAWQSVAFRLYTRVRASSCWSLSPATIGLRP